MTTRVELQSAEVIGNNPSPFNTPISLRVVFHVSGNPPKHPIDVKFSWSPIWDFPVDQDLDELEVGPFPAAGRQDCTLECDPPNLSEIPDPTGPTAMMVSFSYKEQEFLHLGFNIECTCILAETPEEYTDGSVLSRKIGRCFRKVADIAWDEEECRPLSMEDIENAAAERSEEESESTDDDESIDSSDSETPSTKKARLE